MMVLLRKDIEKIGMAGQVVKVSDGYAVNFLIPHKLAIAVTENEQAFFEERKKRVQVSTEVLSSKVGMMAERIRNMHLVIKKRVHDDGKLYGSVGAEEIVDLLAAKDIKVSKKQIDFPKTIKMVGEHKVSVKLTAKHRPEVTVKVVAED